MRAFKQLKVRVGQKYIKKSNTDVSIVITRKLGNGRFYGITNNQVSHNIDQFFLWKYWILMED